MNSRDLNHEIIRVSMILADEIRDKIRDLPLNRTAEIILGRKHTEPSGLKKLCRAFLHLEEAARHTLNLE
jgi:hypothetical protein